MADVTADLIGKVDRRALLNTLKVAARIDMGRVEELARAADQTFRSLGWNAREDAWAMGPLLEIAVGMAAHQDRVDERLPELAAWATQSSTLSPKRWGLDVEQDESITLSILSLSSRIGRLIEKEAFGMSPEEGKSWVLESVLRGGVYLYQQLESMDAAASSDPNVGADGKRMVLQAAIRESMNAFEPVWMRAAKGIEDARRDLPLDQLRSWLAGNPEYQALAQVTDAFGSAVDTLLQDVLDVRLRVMKLQAGLRRAPVAATALPEPTTSNTSAVPAASTEETARQEPAQQQAAAAVETPAKRSKPRFGRQ
ncbi:hypothetical protein [Acidithiobacillus ferriphilus]|uniref:hypothetical protein n=1 Tax=Acidithiobacillus ferriphilus TaxID=1689834 RepID=UPI002DBE2733|nr:hypothetical protein [Acidithiobacillus ferriphilus]MEB8535547.1 hypothetical protein [Acidithiobacillus ferriphilus]